MTDTITAPSEPAQPLGLVSTEGLGLEPEREAVKAAMRRFANAYCFMGDMNDRVPADNALCAAILTYKRAAVAAERERMAKLCIERAQLAWAAADQPYAAEVKMQHEAVAAAMEELAGELRA